MGLKNLLMKYKKIKMSLKILIPILIIVLFFYSQLSGSALKEGYYTKINTIDNIEIRRYNQVVCASYIPKNKADRDNSFRNVAGYIFGKNSDKQKIAMTTPVIIRLHNNNEMAFIMPKSYEFDNLPIPDNRNVNLYKQTGQTKAAITYSGFTNEKKEKEKIKELKSILSKNKIEYDNDFEVLVYNSPFEFINRKNEIIVSIKYKEENNMNLKSVYLGGGCFWCIEAVYENVIGVKKVTSGYAGGTSKNPTYKEVSNGLTNHAEVCEIVYNSEIITLEDILKIFFLAHDPTTLNRQGNDIGKHYRSIILTKDNIDKKKSNIYMQEINNDLYDNKIVTEIKLLENFYIAENYHQNYYFNNKTAPYCNAVISPKLQKVRNQLSNYYSN